MDLPTNFMFRNQLCSCIAFIDNSSIPCYVYVELQEAGLIAEFGKEITVKTDFEKRLPKKDDYPALIEIRQSIFEAIKCLPDFVAAHHKKEPLEHAHPNSFIHRAG